MGKHLSEVWASLTRWQKVAVVFLLLGSFGYIQARLSDTGKPAASSAHIAAVSGAAVTERRLPSARDTGKRRRCVLGV